MSASEAATSRHIPAQLEKIIGIISGAKEFFPALRRAQGTDLTGSSREETFRILVSGVDGAGWGVVGGRAS